MIRTVSESLFVPKKQINDYESSFFNKHSLMYQKLNGVNISKMHVVIVNGTGGSGKDTFVKFCRKTKQGESMRLIKHISTVDKVKQIARLYMGYADTKTEKDRKFLSDLKDAWESYNNGPTNYVVYFVDNLAALEKDHVVFIDCREPEQIENLVNIFKSKGYLVSTLLITNCRVPIIKSNHADKEVLNYSYDYAVANDFDLDYLEKEASKFMEWIHAQTKTS